MVKQLVPRPSDVIHDLVAPVFLERFANSRAKIVEHVIP